MIISKIPIIENTKSINLSSKKFIIKNGTTIKMIKANSIIPNLITFKAIIRISFCFQWSELLFKINNLLFFFIRLKKYLHFSTKLKNKINSMDRIVEIKRKKNFNF